MVPTGVQEFFLYVLGAICCCYVVKIVPFSTIAVTGYLRTLYLSIHPLPTAQLMMIALQVYARFSLIFSCSFLCTPKGILNLMERLLPRRPATMCKHGRTCQHGKTCIPIDVGLWHAVVQLLVLEWPAVKKAIGHIIVTFLALRQAALGADCPSSC